MSCKSPFLSPMDRREDAKNVKMKRFAEGNSGTSFPPRIACFATQRFVDLFSLSRAYVYYCVYFFVDHLTLLSAFDQWRKQRGGRARDDWCRENFLSASTMCVANAFDVIVFVTRCFLHAFNVYDVYLLSL